MIWVLIADSNKSDGEEYTLVVEEQTISTGDMRSFEVTRKPRRKKNVSTKELPEGAGHHHCLVADPSNTFGRYFTARLVCFIIIDNFLCVELGQRSSLRLIAVVFDFCPTLLFF